MAIVNRTTDSFYSGARQGGRRRRPAGCRACQHRGRPDRRRRRVRAGTGPRGHGRGGDPPDVPSWRACVRSSPTCCQRRHWRAEVAREAVGAGADLVKRHLGRARPAPGRGRRGARRRDRLLSHTGGAVPRTDPFQVAYPLPHDAPDDADPGDGVVHDVLSTLAAAARRAVACGVPRESVLVDRRARLRQEHLALPAPAAQHRRLTGLGFPSSWLSPARTSWGRPSTPRRGAARGDPRRDSARRRGWAPRCSGPTTSVRPAGLST